MVLSNYIVQQARMYIQTRFPAHGDQFDELMQTCRYEVVPDPTESKLFITSISCVTHLIYGRPKRRSMQGSIV